MKKVKLFNWKTLVFLLSLVLFFFPKQAFADQTKYAVIVNPIRGKDFWSENFSILDTPQKQYQLISSEHLPATWLVRYDALVDPSVDNFLKSLDNSQEIGLFLEVTPTLTTDAQVKYNQSQSWHYAKSVLLVGYSPDDRKKLIDIAFAKYKEIFGSYPKSVGAWWIDAGSLSYMKQKYGIEANLDVADQFSTDQYQVWGQYWSTPFYPAKNNALMPAPSADNKIGVVTMQWATRDPYNAYGNGVEDSTFSVQANDYLLHNLTTDYFDKLLNLYFQTTVGLENSFSWDKYGSEYTNQIKLLSSKQSSGSLLVKNMSMFSQTYQSLFPDISPSSLIISSDPLGGEGKVVWYQTPEYRIAWFFGPYGAVIRDLHIYKGGLQEPCLDKSCTNLNLADSFVSALDDVSLKTRWVLDQGTISNFQVKTNPDSVEIDYTNQAGVVRYVKFLDNDINVNGKIYTLATAVLNASVQPSISQPQPDNRSFQTKLNLPAVWPSMANDFVKFMLLTVFFFFIPGWILSRRIILAIPVGWVVFTLVSYILGYLHLDKGLWSIPIAAVLAGIIWGFPKIKFLKLNLKSVALGFLILIGSLVWLTTVARSGLPYDYGFAYWGPNGHDAIWHLALISELNRSFPPQNPVLAGIPLTNYHYFFDLLIARSVYLFNIDAQNLLFRFYPFFISILSGVLFAALAHKMFRSYKADLLAVFFLYFGGGLGWILSFVKDRTFGGESVFWAQESISTLLNPPFAVSLVLLFAGMYLLYQYLEKRNTRSLILITLIFGTLIEFKAYAGVVILGALGIHTLEQLLKRRYNFLPLTASAGILAALVFLPNNLSSSSLFVISPFWFVNSMVLFQDRLNWQRLSLAMMSDSIPKIIGAYALGFLIFIFGNFGLRTIGFLSFETLKKHRIVLYMIALGIFIPLIIIQKGTSWNSIQFMYYSMILSGLFSALFLVSLWNRLGNIFGAGLVLAVLLITLPTTYGTVSQYIPIRPPAKLSNDEIAALTFLKSQPDGVVLTMPYDENLKSQFKEPVPLLAYASTAYVPAFSNHPSFVDDTINLDILGVKYKGRLNEQSDFLKFRDRSYEMLKRDNISYVYYPKAYNFQFDLGKMGMQEIYENNEVIIFKVI